MAQFRRVEIKLEVRSCPFPVVSGCSGFGPICAIAHLMKSGSLNYFTQPAILQQIGHRRLASLLKPFDADLEASKPRPAESRAIKGGEVGKGGGGKRKGG